MRKKGRRLTCSVPHQRVAGRHNRQNNTAARLITCGIALALITAFRLVFPQMCSALWQSVVPVVGQDPDFAEAFAAVGRAVGGEEAAEQSLQDAFQAVFGSSEIRAEKEPSATTQADAQSQNLTTQEPDIWENGSEDGVAEKTQVPDASVLYTMQSLPENASLEQRNLGFPCITPVVGTLSSAFGWREHPTEGGTRFHYGIDLVAQKGSEILAFADGEVFAVGESSTLGKYIILTHAGGYRTLYAHCSEVVVRSGSVKMGDVIARVGDSGGATGSHLHFELQDGSLYLNPIYYVEIR